MTPHSTTITNNTPSPGFDFDYGITGAESLEAALAQCGWTRTGTSWFRGKWGEQATLSELPESAQWRHFELEAPKLAGRTNSRVLFDNFGLSRLMKLVARPSGHPICRLDVPTEFNEPAGMDSDPFAASAGANPVLYWAMAGPSGALSAMSAKSFDDSKSEADEMHLALTSAFSATLDRSVEHLKSAGWSASTEDERIFVNLTLPGVFRQVEIAPRAVAGSEPAIVVGCDLITLPTEAEEQNFGLDATDDFGCNVDTCIKAIVHVAREANARLPLVRYSIDRRDTPWRLRAEVTFCVTPIPGAWLLKALEVIQSAVATTALELEALRGDAELSKLVLETSLAKAGLNSF